MTTALKAARASVIIIAVVAFFSLAISLIMIERAGAMNFAPTPPELALALTRAGLTPEGLTASGFTTQQTEDVVTNVNSYLLNNPIALSEADEALAQARITHDELLGRIRAGIASQEEINALPGAQAALASAQTGRANVLSAIFAAGVDELPPVSVTTLTQIRANDELKFPTEFLVLELTEAESLELRNALADERISAASGEEQNPAYQTLLSDTRAIPAVADAINNLANNLNSITNAWNQACGL